MQIPKEYRSSISILANNKVHVYALNANQLESTIECNRVHSEYTLAYKQPIISTDNEA